MRRKLVIAAIVLFELAITYLLLLMGLAENCDDDQWLCTDTAFLIVLAAWWVVPALAFIYDQAAKAKKRPPR